MTATRAVALYRIVAAGVMWVLPGPIAKPFGMGTPADQPGTYLGRVFASRDVALGVGVEQASGAARRHWLTVGVAVDAVDLAAAGLAARSGALSRTSAVLCALASGVALVLGLKALGEES